MKKQIIIIPVYTFLLCISLSMQAQTNTFPSSGNVGIGTTSPIYKLDVRTVAPTKGAYFQTSGLWQAIDFSSDGGVTKGSLSANGNKLYIGVASSGTNPFQTIDLSTGRVGIGTGTTTPTSLLTVNMSGTGAQSPSFELQSNNTTGLKLSNANSFQDAWIDHNYSSANNIIFALRGTEKMRLTNSGNVGINTTTPLAKLQVKDGSVLFDGTTGTTPVSGAGTRMMWVPVRSAFRVGYVGGNQWDDGNIGISSIAMGESTQATGSVSTAFGSNSIASGPYSTAFGLKTTASGNYSTAFGRSNTASGHYSTSSGYATIAQSYNSFVIGQYNYNPGTYNSTMWVATDPLFVIGNGTSSTATSNAITVFKNGNTGIGVVAPIAKLQVSGWGLFSSSSNPTSAAVIRNNTVFSTATTPDFTWWNNDQAGIFHPAADVLAFTTVGTERMRINSNGSILIGNPNTTLPTGYKLYVETGILTERLRVAIKGSTYWPDYVFTKNYQLQSLEDIEQFVQKNQHLPDMPSAVEVAKEGLDVADMNAKLLQKIEELTLHMIEMNKKIQNQDQLIKRLQNPNTQK